MASSTRCGLDRARSADADAGRTVEAPHGKRVDVSLKPSLLPIYLLSFIYLSKGVSLFVITADQIGSRRSADLVPEALAVVVPLCDNNDRAFERTAGDEIQGVFAEPSAVLTVIVALLRHGHWRVGIGIGPVQKPLPVSARAGRGPAFIGARHAVEAATTSTPLAVRPGPGPEHPEPPEPIQRSERRTHAVLAEHALVLLARIIERRSPEGWEVCDLLDQGHTSAISQRVRRADWADQGRARELAEHHLSVADGRPLQ